MYSEELSQLFQKLELMPALYLETYAPSLSHTIKRNNKELQSISVSIHTPHLLVSIVVFEEQQLFHWCPERVTGCSTECVGKKRQGNEHSSSLSPPKHPGCLGRLLYGSVKHLLLVGSRFRHRASMWQQQRGIEAKQQGEQNNGIVVSLISIPVIHCWNVNSSFLCKFDCIFKALERKQYCWR